MVVFIPISNVHGTEAVTPEVVSTDIAAYKFVKILFSNKLQSNFAYSKNQCSADVITTKALLSPEGFVSGNPSAQSAETIDSEPKINHGRERCKLAFKINVRCTDKNLQCNKYAAQ
jgi:hypothetical protein